MTTNTNVPAEVMTRLEVVEKVAQEHGVRASYATSKFINRWILHVMISHEQRTDELVNAIRAATGNDPSVNITAGVAGDNVIRL